jgi:predicted metal-dependent phosphoesterase TrpH
MCLIVLFGSFEKHLDIIAITDHNSCENVQVTMSLENNLEFG